MGGGRSRRWGLAVVVGLILGVTTAPVAAPEATAAVAVPVAADDPDADTRADYRYRPDLDRGVVAVEIEVVVTADKPNVPTADGVFQYFFERYGLLIPPEAEELTVTDASGVALTQERESLDDFTDLLTVEFRRNIFYRQSAVFTVAFELPTGPAGSTSIVRVNAAHASFEAWVSPNLEEATLTVDLPTGFEDRGDGLVPFRLEPGDDGGSQLVLDELDPEEFYTLVSLGDEDRLDVLDIDLATVFLDSDVTGTIRVESWPGDVGWTEHVEDGIADGLPALQELVGLPWPIEGELVITESFSPVLYGYAGWYDRANDVIEVSDERDDLLLYHELSHVWFNDSLFLDRWVNEGLAELYAAETAGALGAGRPEPEPTSRTDEGAIPLDEFDGLLTPTEEAWGYRASWTLIEAVADEIGMEGMAQILEAADGREVAYVGDVEPERYPARPDWRRLLDLAENIQGVDEGPLADLFQTWVVEDVGPGADQDDERFDQRADARATYLELVETGDGWAVPYGVRRRLTGWDFERAQSLMAETRTALDRRDDLEDLLAPTGAALPAELETTFEASDDDLEAFSTDLADVREAGVEVREAHDLLADDRSILERVGLLGADPERDQDLAVAALSEGRLADATAAANEVDARIAAASGQGTLRVALAALLLATVLAGGAFLLVARRRRVRGEPIPAPGAGSPTDLTRAPDPGPWATTATLPRSHPQSPSAMAQPRPPTNPPPAPGPEPRTVALHRPEGVGGSDTVALHRPEGVGEPQPGPELRTMRLPRPETGPNDDAAPGPDPRTLPPPTGRPSDRA